MAIEIDMGGQVALVTGGTKGIGRAITLRLLEAGADVAICARNEPVELPSFTDPDGTTRTAAFTAGDVRSAEGCAAIVAFAIETFGRLDLLVNNAGGSPEVDAATVSPRFHESIIALNLTAPLHMAQAAYASLAGNESGGHIINIASVSGLRPSPGTAAYGASKAGLVSLSQSLSAEWGPKVRVNTLSAGMILTPDAMDFYGGEAGVEAISDIIPLGRMGSAEDIADATVALASPLNRYAAGENFVVHGGGEQPGFSREMRRATRG